MLHYSILDGMQFQLTNLMLVFIFQLCKPLASVLFCSFEQGYSLLWTHALRAFYNRTIALAQGGEEFWLMMCASVNVTKGYGRAE